MTTKITTKDLLERNRQISSGHKSLPLLSEMKSTPSIAIVTCVDPRCVPEQFLGLEAGEAVVFRNVAGHVAPNIYDLAAIDVALGLEEVLVIHHTDCGATHFKDDNIRQALTGRINDDAKSLPSTFGAITDLEQSVRDDVKALHSSPLIRKELAAKTSGYVFDIKTGLLTEVN